MHIYTFKCRSIQACLPFWHFFNRHERGKKISGFAKKRSQKTLVTMDLRLWLCYLPPPPFSPQIHERVLTAFTGRSFRVQVLSLTWRGRPKQPSLAVMHLHAVGAGGCRGGGGVRGLDVGGSLWWLCWNPVQSWFPLTPPWFPGILRD